MVAPRLVVALLFTVMAACNQEAADEIKSIYPLGQSYEQLSIDSDGVIFDHLRLREPRAPIMIAVKGYAQPRRSLQSGERLVIVELSFDLVVHLYFCRNGLLCKSEVLGS